MTEKENTEIRNILLIGSTGNGKSTLANVLVNKNGEFEEVFKESEFVESRTRETQSEEIEVDGIKYRIIDTIGIGDTSMTKQQVLNKLAEVAYSIRDGLNQVLFVTSGRFTEAEIEAYNILRTVIFDENIINHTTIVRTKFPSFRKPEKRKEDKEMMIRINVGNSELIKSCKKIIHVNNLTKEEEETQQSRKESRTILLTNLHLCQDIYRPTNLNELNERISSYVNEKNDLLEKLKDLEDKVKYLSDQEKMRTEQEMTKIKEKLEELEKTIAEQTQGFFEWVGKGIDKTATRINKKFDQKIVQPIKDSNCSIM